MSEAELLTLNEGDFVVLEEAIEFDESVQREERVRFYIQSEQEQDAFEKLIPTGASTRTQRERARREVTYYSDLYNKFIVPTTEDYELRQEKKAPEVDWVVPIFGGVELKDNELEDMGELNRAAANWYPRMIRSFPQPYQSEGENVYPIEKATEFTNKEGKIRYRALPEFRMVTTLVNEDKTIEIRKKPISGTGDVLSSAGYYLYKRPVSIPNPLPGHPFFESEKEGVLTNTAPLVDIFPSMDAIFTHGIPVTGDPYGEASPYLKVYDVKLSEVPWSLWKTRFPPVSLENELRERVDIQFPKSEGTTVSNNVQELYGTQHYGGMSPREWLMRQDDGGALIVKLLLSESNEFGNVEVIPGIDLPLPGYPATTVEECRLAGISFQDFSTRGVLRRKWEGNKVSLSCVPLEYIQQERARIGYTGRTNWRDDTSDKIKEKHIRLLKKYAPLKEVEGKKELGPRTPGKEVSEVRKQVLAILHDDNRDRADKLRDIKVLLDGTIYNEQTYTDQAGLFVVCAHTMELLSGSLIANPTLFYDTWGVRELGFYVCKVCGQHIDSMEYDTSDDFDANKMAIRHTGVLDVQKEEEIVSSTSLQKIKHLLDKKNSVHLIMFLLLGLLQVEPTVDKMPMYLNMAATAAEGTGSPLLRGAIGLVATGILLQTHQPFLIPRRAFGPKPLKLSGYPRDTDEPGKETVFDSLLLVIRKTFEAYPSSVNEMYASFVREIVKDSSKVRNLVLRVYKEQFLKKNPELNMMFETARMNVVAPVEEAPSTLPTVVPVPETLGQIKNYPPCGGSSIVLHPPHPPKLRQAEAPLRTGISAARSFLKVVPSLSAREETAPVAKADISRLLTAKNALDATYLKGKIGDSVQTNLAIASRLADMYRMPIPVRSVDPNQSPAELRDYARGLVYSLVKAIMSVAATSRDFNERVQSDITLMCLLAKLDEEKKEVRKISANERLSYVKINAKMTDIERETNTELVKIGLGPVLITLEDRDILARREEEDVEDLEAEVGVGLVQDNALDEGQAAPNADHGDYGDLPGRFAGRDVEVPGFADDGERGI
jgi:hypothetical protein